MTIKTMDEIREEIQGIAKQCMDEALKTIINTKEEILIAFIAKYGLQPDEIAMCYQGTRCWVEKRIKDSNNC